MNPRTRITIALSTMILGICAVLAFADELVEEGRWGMVWINVAVTVALAGVTVLVSEMRAAQLTAARDDVTAEIRQLRDELHRLTLADARTQPLPILQAVGAGPPVVAYVGRAPVVGGRPDDSAANVIHLPSSGAARPAVPAEDIPPDNVRAFELGRRIGRGDAPTMPPA